MTTKPAYKLQEFVAHSSSVNCLKIGRKSSRVLLTGGEDCMVNLWAIGKPNAILNLSGHTSGIDSVSFDSSEVFVAAGAANGTIKLWDLEEAKIVRTLTGHRSNCISVDFHPFGEFFASGSLDTNLKIWDIRKKGCIHTYKGHTRGVNAIRFTPDGRWVVSGGEDSSVKLWDLTAGKLLHDFKCHEGQIQCIDFHPNEFLLATGSADRTIKFWDLETFELIGSSGPESSALRCLTFNPDGRTILCGLQESLKVLSWEPLRCHDSVDVGWSRLSDLNVHDGKLLGCSYNQSCVGVWVVDMMRLNPYTAGNNTRLNGKQSTKSASGGNHSVLAENPTKDSYGRSVSENIDAIVRETKSVGRMSFSQNLDPIAKESKDLASSGHPGGTPLKVVSPKTTSSCLVTIPSAILTKRNAAKTNSGASNTTISKSDVPPVIVPRNNMRLEQTLESGKDVGILERTISFPLHSKTSNFQKIANRRNAHERLVTSDGTVSNGFGATDLSGVAARNILPSPKTSVHENPAAEMVLKDDSCNGCGLHDINSIAGPPASNQLENYKIAGTKSKQDTSSIKCQQGQQGGITRPLVANGNTNESNSTVEGQTLSDSRRNLSTTNVPSNKTGVIQSVAKEVSPSNGEDAVGDIIEHHDRFVSIMQSRFGKLQAIHRYWGRNDIKGAIGAMGKMSDHSVNSDVISVLTEKFECVTLDICSCILPLLACLLDSDTDRHLCISMGMVLKVVKVFGSVIYSTLSAPPCIGVDIEAEQRLERCNVCFIELEKIKCSLPAVSRCVSKIRLESQVIWRCDCVCLVGIEEGVRLRSVHKS